MSKYFLRKNRKVNTIIMAFEGRLTADKLYAFLISVDTRPQQITKDFCGKIENTEEAINAILDLPEMYIETTQQEVQEILDNAVKKMIF